MDERRNLFHFADLSEEVLKGFFANVLIHLVSMEGVEPTQNVPAYETGVLPIELHRPYRDTQLLPNIPSCASNFLASRIFLSLSSLALRSSSRFRCGPNKCRTLP